MSQIVIRPDLSTIVVEDTAPRIVLLNGSNGIAAQSLVQLLDTPDLYPPGPDYAIFGNTGLDGFVYRRLAPSAFISLSFDAFTASASSGPFQGQSVFDRGYSVPGVTYGWTLNTAPEVGVITFLPGDVSQSFTGTSGTYSVAGAINDPGIAVGTYTVDSTVGGYNAAFLFLGSIGIDISTARPFPGGTYPTDGPQVIYTNATFFATHFAQITADLAVIVPETGFTGRVLIDWRGYWEPSWVWTSDAYKTAWRAYINTSVPGSVAGLTGEPLEAAYKTSYEAAVRSLYTQTYAKIKELRPQCSVGWVGVPIRMFSQLLGATNPFDLTEARRVNTQDLAWFYTLVDFVVADLGPVKYAATVADPPDVISIEENTLFTTGMIVEARRVAINKPVYGFFRFRYDVLAAGSYADQYMNADNLSAVLNQPKDNGAAGVIVDDFFFTEYEYIFWQDFFDVSGSPAIEDVIDVTPTPGATSGDATIEVTGTVDAVSETATLTWKFRAYWGWSALTSLNQTQIKALSGNALLSGFPDFVDITFNSGTSYGYYAQPSRWTAPLYFIDGYSGLSIDMTNLGTVAVTNAYGVTQDYAVWRTTYPTNALNVRLKME